MPTPRWALSTSVVNGKIYAIGSWQPGITPVVEEYDTGFVPKSVEAKGKLPTLWGQLKVHLESWGLSLNLAMTGRITHHRMMM